jgi:hypothetical protein
MEHPQEVAAVQSANNGHTGERLVFWAFESLLLVCAVKEVLGPWALAGALVSIGLYWRGRLAMGFPPNRLSMLVAAAVGILGIYYLCSIVGLPNGLRR